MKRTFKRIVSLLLVAVMVFGAVPLSGFVGLELPDWLDFSKLFAVEAEAATYSGTCGANLTWTLDTSTGVLEISGTGTMTDWASYSSVPWYSKRSKIKSVTIPDGVTSIGDNAFRYCDSLTSVTIGNSVTSIGEDAFYYCDSLASVYYTGDIAGWCGIEFGNSYSNPMCYADNLYIDGALVEGDIVIPDGVTAIPVYAFRSCDGITSVTIPDSVTTIYSHAFYGCGGLKSVTIGNSVTSIGYYAFAYCDSLASVTIPDSVTSIGEDAFYYCSSLTSVTIGNSVTSIGNYAFAHCDSLASVTIPDSVTSIGDNAFYDCSSLTSITIGNGVTSIGDWAFYNCSSLTSVTIGNSVTSIGDDAFYNCDSLTSVTIPDSVTSIGDWAFDYCDSLTSVTIGNGVTSIGYAAFYNCYSLTSVTIPDSVTSIGDAAFSVCDSLTSITVDSANTAYSSDEYGVLFNKDKTVLIQYPAGNPKTSYSIPDSVTSIGSHAFYYCENLTSVTIGNGVTSIGNYAFAHCSSLTSITIGNGVTSIGNYAFYDCSSLSDVYYSGTEAEWKAISIGSDNRNLTNATIHYNYSYKESDELKLNQELITISNKVSPIICVDKYPKGVTADDLIWSSSNDGVAYVNEDNVVTPVHYGKTDITVSTADGKYSATCEVTVEASFVITSESSNVKSIRCGDTAKYRIYFLNYKAEELSVNDVTATITENGVLDVLSCDKYDKYIELEVKALREGATIIEVESDEPLAYNKFKISVYPENVDWRADKVPNYGKTNTENFSRSTFVVENYSYVYNENDSTYTVTMDVYNMAGDYPVLAAYNSFGELVDFDAADRFVAMPGDWIDFFGTLGFGAVQMMNGDLFTYRSVTRSKKSTISVEVPADGYITISNDITVCPVAAIYNISGLLIEAVSVSCSFSADEADKNNDITKEFVKSLKNKIPNFEETLNKLIEEFLKKSAKKVSSDYLVSVLLFSKEAIYELCEDAGSSFEEIAGDVVLSVLDKDIQDFISKTVMETLIKKELVEAVALSKLKAADKYFTAGKVLGLADFAFHVAAFNTGSGLTTIQFNPCGENGFVCKDTIKITSTIIDEDTLLHHFVIMDPNKKTLAKEELKINFNDIVEVHEIALIKNGKKVEDVMFRATVEMDIPKNMFGPSVKVFRIEKDGTYTKLETTIIMNRKVVFTTDHFSEYILTGRSIGDVVVGVALNTDTYEIINKQTYQLEAMVSPDTASNKKVVWSSDNEKVATVDENGLITANSLGTAVITVTTVDGGYSASCKVTVLPREFTVTWNIDGVETSTTVSEGSAIIKPENPTKDGYKFMGWTPAVPDAMPAYDMTFTAVFEKSYICPECGNEILGENAINAHISAENAAKIKTTVKIKNNSGSKTINYGETLRLTAITTDMPADAKIYWYVNSKKAGEGETFDVSPSSGSVEVTVNVVGENGNVLVNTDGNEVSDSQKVSVNSSFWQKIVSFFKNLFGINRTVIQIFNVVS